MDAKTRLYVAWNPLSDLERDIKSQNLSEQSPRCTRTSYHGCMLFPQVATRGEARKGQWDPLILARAGTHRNRIGKSIE